MLTLLGKRVYFVQVAVVPIPYYIYRAVYEVGKLYTL